ncbi:MAG: molecular chaperone DnaJ, partial [Leptospira sp.]|nr:molecular chaperone DnaJ [Leptospira sp.]
HIESIEQEFLKGGIYFGEKYLLEIREYFISFLYSIMESHRLDKDLLMLLASATIEFDDACDSYFDDKFDLEVLAERCASYYVDMKSIDTNFGADFFLRDYLLTQVKYNKIRLREITLEFRSRAHYDLFGEEQQKASAKKNISPELGTLLNFFKLQESATRSDLKKRFKELLKIYHPDINKEGLEKTKLIIVNYKKLSAILK